MAWYENPYKLGIAAAVIFGVGSGLSRGAASAYLDHRDAVREDAQISEITNGDWDLNGHPTPSYLNAIGVPDLDPNSFTDIGQIYCLGDVIVTANTNPPISHTVPNGIDCAAIRVRGIVMERPQVI